MRSYGPGTAGENRHKWRLLLTLGVVVALLVAAYLVPTTTMFNRHRIVLIAILGIAVLMWSAEVLDHSVTALGIMVILVLSGTASLGRVWGQLGNPIVGLVVAVYIVAFAVRKCGLDRRIALGVMTLARGRSSRMLLAFMVATFVFTFFIPTSMGRAAIVLSIAGGLTGGSGMTDRKLLKAVFISIPFVSLLASSATVTGASGMVYAAGIFENQLGYSWTYLGWLLAFLPLSLLMIAVLWRLLLRFFPSSSNDMSALADELSRQKARIGPMGTVELKVTVILLLMLGGWATHSLHGLDTTMVALIVAVVFFLPGVRVIEWRETATAVNWGSLLIFSCSLALADAMSQTGLADSIAALLSGVLTGAAPWTTAVGVIAMMFVIRLGLNNITSALAVALPVVFSLSRSIGINPAWLGMVAIAASCLAFLLPSQAIASLTSYGFGHFTMRDMRRAGAAISVLFASAIVLTSLFYWPLLGYSPL